MMQDKRNLLTAACDFCAIREGVLPNYYGTGKAMCYLHRGQLINTFVRALHAGEFVGPLHVDTVRAWAREHVNTWPAKGTGGENT